VKGRFVGPYAPTRIRTRPFHLVRALRSAGHEVTVATLWANDEERAALDDLADASGPIIAEHQPARQSLLNCVRALPSGEPLQAGYNWDPRFAARLTAAARDTAFEAVHVEHLRGVRYALHLAKVLEHRPDRPALVWDSVDCISTLFRRASLESPSFRVRLAARFELPRTERYEAAVAGCFDRVLVTSEADRTDLLALAKAGDRTARPPRIDVVPNGVDLEYFSPTAAPRNPLSLVITGKMSYHANVTAVTRFVEEVMPLVWSELPAVRVFVVGKDPTPEVKKLGRPWAPPFEDDGPSAAPGSRILITGTVADLRPFLRGAALAVAPICYGVGIQNKVLEAMACATPVVATREAVTGIAARPGEDLAVASEPRELAASIVALLKDPDRRARLGEAGRAFVERHHGWPGVAARVADIYRHARP
jgi:glycosyltransferase involved in cell wall biosynthesis